MNRPIFFIVALLLGILPLLACTTGVAITRAPRWACPSPTPLPWGLDGPVKEVIRHTRPITDGGDWEEEIFFEQWEQEYADLGGPPFPSPTPYALVGSSYVFGQRVELWPVHVQVSASSGPTVDLPGQPTGSQRLYLIAITWVNHTLDALPVDYRQQVRLRAITTPSGAVISDSRWGVTPAALKAANLTNLPTSIPPGESSAVIPIVGPTGEPQTVEIDFSALPGMPFVVPTTTTLSGTSTPTAIPTLTPTPATRNTELRAAETNTLTVQWSAGSWSPGGAEPCDDPGALTDWANGRDVAWVVEEPLSIAAPPGAERVVQIALNQVGKPYIWGAKGPEAFDCSGLMTWSYGQIGLRIPHGTAGQWPGMGERTQAALQPGDLIFFAIGGGRIDHVGMLVGDLNGDGLWDMVHAASPALGVRVDYGVFESAYYRERIVGFRTAR
jgi:cell wall-associated NlpC family hydrolase